MAAAGVSLARNGKDTAANAAWFLLELWCGIRAVVILILALPLVVFGGSWSLLRVLLEYLTWPFVLLVQHLYVRPLQRWIVRYVYPTRVGRCHLLCTRRRGGSAKQHSHIVRVRVASGCSVFPIPCLKDNYAYLVVVERRGSPMPAVVIDPSDADTVLNAVDEIQRDHYGGRSIELKAVLTTHKHWDHAGGNAQLVKLFPWLRVYGGENERVPYATDLVREGQAITLVDTLRFEVLETPCHTRGHLVYLLEVEQEPWKPPAAASLFAGDTLFLGGHGALFEGTKQEMLQNLAKITRRCGPETFIFPGHEYTQQNLAATMRWDAPFESPAAFLATAGAWWCAVHRRWWHEGVPTVPGRLCDEQMTHPSLRELNRFASIVKSATHRPSRDDSFKACVSTEVWTCPTDFEVLPNNLGSPFVTLWRHDWQRHKAFLRARRPRDALIELEAAEQRFRSWEEPWCKGGMGQTRRLPTSEDLAHALAVLGCNTGADNSNGDAEGARFKDDSESGNQHGGFDLAVLRRSLEVFGHPLGDSEMETLERVVAKSGGGKLGETTTQLAKELLRDSKQVEDAWRGFGPLTCFACRGGDVKFLYGPVRSTCEPGTPMSAALASPRSGVSGLTHDGEMRRHRSFGEKNLVDRSVGDRSIGDRSISEKLMPGSAFFPSQADAAEVSVLAGSDDPTLALTEELPPEELQAEGMGRARADSSPDDEMRDQFPVDDGSFPLAAIYGVQALDTSAVSVEVEEGMRTPQSSTGPAFTSDRADTPQASSKNRFVSETQCRFVEGSRQGNIIGDALAVSISRHLSGYDGPGAPDLPSPGSSPSRRVKTL